MKVPKEEDEPSTQTNQMRNSASSLRQMACAIKGLTKMLTFLNQSMTFK